jgi:predicted transcriptional regulator
MYHVYELLDPITLLPFYIGKGSGEVLTRLDDHIMEASKPIEEQKNQLKCNKINSIIRLGYIIKHRITMFDTESEAFEYERLLIMQYGRKIDSSGILTNLCPGGRGGWANFGKVVYQFNLSGELITEHLSMKSAAAEVGVTTSAIWNCLSTTQPSTQSGNYIWSRTPELQQKCVDAVKNRKKQSNVIYQISTTGRLVDEFSGIKEAADKFQVKWWAIGAILNSHTKMCKGYFWATDVSNHYITMLQCDKDGDNPKYIHNANAAAVYLGISASAIGRQIKGGLKMVRGYKFKYVNLPVFGNGVGT